MTTTFIDPGDVAVPTVDLSRKVSRARRVRDGLFKGFLLFSILLSLGTLGTLIITTLVQGWDHLNLDLLGNMPSARPARAGIQSAIFGSLWVVGLAAILSLPFGVGTALYLEEFARHDRWYNRLIALNIQNLAGVPAVVYGMHGLAFIVRGPFSWGFTVGSAALVLTLLVLPVVIIASREAIRAVPPSYREGSLALGATKWQTVWRSVLPSAIPGIATASILSVSRALGESAPLLLLGALAFVTFNPQGLDSSYTVLPLLIFKYSSDAKTEFHAIAAAAIIVLLAMLLLLNSVAIVIRNHFQKRT
jgi:phosphate transport system permease protein